MSSRHHVRHRKAPAAIIVAAVSPTSMTAQSPAGTARTCVINSETNAITGTGSQIGPPMDAPVAP